MLQQSKAILIKEWQNIYTSKQAKFILVSNVEGYKYRKQGSHFIVLNPSLPKKKEIGIIASARKNKNVFLGFDSSHPNYTNVPEKQVMFHINLDSEEIITKQNTYKITENFFEKEDEDDQIEQHAHLVLINTSPLCKNHSIIVMYPEEQLPQIVGQDIVLLLLNIFKLFPNIKVGYNSIGASSSVNHLHFHMLFAEDLIGAAFLPIEKQPSKPWKKTTLINPNQQINLYSVGVQIQEMQGPISQGFVLLPLGQGLDPSQVASSLSFVFGIIANELIQLCIPHNVLFSDCGNKIYIMIRQFANQKSPSGWVEFSGVIPVSDQAGFQMKQQAILSMKSELKVQNNLIEALKSNINKNLASFI